MQIGSVSNSFFAGDLEDSKSTSGGTLCIFGCHSVRARPHKLPTRKKSHGMIDDLDNVDFISSNVHSSRQEALLYVFEDNEAVIKMITKGRSPTMRHV